MINLENFSKFPDGTYSIKGKKINRGKGYQVSFHEIGKRYSSKEYSILVRYIQGITGASPEVGIFKGGVPHISFCVGSEKVAQMICQMFGQLAYWDWRARKSIFM